MLSGYKICHWLKLHSRWFKIYISVKKTYFDKLLDFPILLLLFFHSLLECHIYLFEYWIFFNTTRVSNSLDPDQSGCFEGLDLGPNCLQKLSADDKSCHKLAKTTSQYYVLAKPWLKSISFDSNFFHLAKVLAKLFPFG